MPRPKTPGGPTLARAYRLPEADRRRLARIVARLAERDQSIPNETRSIRWAIHELDLRLDGDGEIAPLPPK